MVLYSKASSCCYLVVLFWFWIRGCTDWPQRDPSRSCICWKWGVVWEKEWQVHKCWERWFCCLQSVVSLRRPMELHLWHHSPCETQRYVELLLVWVSAQMKGSVYLVLSRKQWLLTRNMLLVDFCRTYPGMFL